MCLGTAHHSLAPPILNHTLGNLGARSVITVEGASRHIKIKLRPVNRHLRLEVVEYFFWQTAGIRIGLHHQRRHCADEDRLSDATLAVARYVTCDLTAPGRVANMDGVL